ADNDPLADTATATGVDLGTGLAFNAAVGAALDVVQCCAAADCDDHNPCTVDRCVANACTHDAGNAGAVCRPSAAICDVAETCDGQSGTCPADAFASPTTVCRTAVDECDASETCPGSGPHCPSDAVKPSSTACTDDGKTCTTDTCDGVNRACQHK